MRATTPSRYEDFLGLIREINKNPNLSLADAPRDNRYTGYIAEEMGIEVLSIYLVPWDEMSPAEFLHEAVEKSLDPPMFWATPVSAAPPTGPTPPPLVGTRFSVTAVEPQTVNARRSEQHNILAAETEHYTSADLCVRGLVEPAGAGYAVVPFGEVLSYCFLYRLISARTLHGPAPLGIEAWKALLEKHRSRPGTGPSERRRDFARGIYRWYKDQVHSAHPPRTSLKQPIQAVYALDAALLEKLGRIVDELDRLADDQVEEKLNGFAADWATHMLKEFRPLPQEQWAASFWERTIINPEMEELLCSRGLYVSVIRSPLYPAHGVPSAASKVYTICTLRDAEILNESTCQQLDRALIELTREDLNRYDSQDLLHGRDVLKLQDAALNKDIDVHGLLVETAKLLRRLTRTDGVLVAWPGVGVYASLSPQHDGQSDEPISMWFDDMSTISNVASILSHSIVDPLGADLKDGTNFSADADKISASLRRGGGDWKLMQAIPLGERREGLAVLLSRDRRAIGGAAVKRVLAVGRTLEIGLAMPFRRVIGSGLFSNLASVLCHPILSARDVISRIRDTGRRESGEGLPESVRAERLSRSTRLQDWLVATLLEGTKIAFLLIGFLFTVFVFHVLLDVSRGIFWHAGEGGGSEYVVRILQHVEHLVMAFSICLAATGIVFLLRPTMERGQPAWMLEFAKLGTLERTLVKLAAMILTIDTLRRALENPPVIQADNFLQYGLDSPIVRIFAYLLMLVGLWFVSRVLAEGESEKPHRDELPISSQR